MVNPDGVLGEIVARKRADVAARFGSVPLGDLRSRAVPTRRSLQAALARQGARFIMEVKRASPSGGALRPSADPAALARAYAGVADAISVLTDAPYFGGSHQDLALVRGEYDGPILCKDFIVDLRQVAEARLYGADAVLVMLSVLDDSMAAEVVREAKLLGMDALVEVHDRTEMQRALQLGARIIGINNRNLQTLQVDLATTERLAPMVPPDRLLVAESGIGGRADVERLSSSANAFLVGSTLVSADNLVEAARALVFGRVKICGLTNRNDVKNASDSGAVYGGIVMVPNTPRAVSFGEAPAIADAAAASGIGLVGVFRNKKVMQVALAARELGLHAVQLHGEEDVVYIKALRKLLPAGTEIWAASPVGDEIAESRLGADRILFDAAVNGRSGGTGIRFDWSRIADRDGLGSALLAGGLNASNAAAASRVGAFALDVGSGVEIAPGRKDGDKLRAFFEALRPRARGEVRPC